MTLSLFPVHGSFQGIWNSVFIGSFMVKIVSSETVGRYKSKSMKQSVTTVQILREKASDWPLRHLRNKINVVRTHSLKAHVVADGREYNIFWVRAPEDSMHVGLLLTEDIAAKIRKLGARGKRWASRPGWFTTRERTRGSYWIGGWVGPRLCLDAF